MLFCIFLPDLFCFFSPLCEISTANWAIFSVWSIASHILQSLFLFFRRACIHYSWQLWGAIVLFAASPNVWCYYPVEFKLFFPKVQVYYINRPLLIEPEPTGASPVWVFPDGTRSILFCMFLPICFAFPRPYAEYQKNISRFICMNYSSSQALCRAFLFFATLASITPGSSEVQLCFSLRHPTFTAISPLNLSCFFQKFRYTVIIDLYWSSQSQQVPDLCGCFPTVQGLYYLAQNNHNKSGAHVHPAYFCSVRPQNIPRYMRFESCSSARIPATLFPFSSSAGE